MLKGNIKKNLIFIVGLGLVWLAFGVWGYSYYQINTNESIVASQSSSIEQVLKAKGALEWWNNYYTTTTIPLSIILSLAGIIILIMTVLAKEKGWKVSDFIKIEIVKADEEET